MPVTPTVTTQNGGQKIFTALVTADFASTLTLATSVAVDVTVTGATIGDTVIVNPLTDLATGIFVGTVSAADNVKIYFKNFSAGTVDPASAVYALTVIKSGGSN